MAAPLAMDLRIRVMNDVEAGMSAEDAAKYSISARTIYDWKRIQRETGAVRPRRGKRGPTPKLASHERAIRAAVKQYSSITRGELRETLRLPVCVRTSWNALRAWGVALKKSCGRLNNSGRMWPSNAVGGTS